MKLRNNTAFITCLLSVILGCELAVRAVILPVTEDTCSTTAGKINPATGKAVTLSVTAKEQAFLIFDLSKLPASVTAGNLTSARLNLYVSSLVTSGDLTVHLVTNGWQENTANVAAPGFSAGVVGTIPSSDLAAKTFIEVDMTSAVSNWLNGANNFGVAITTATGNVRLGSKEGLGTGFPALLEIETAVNAATLNVSQLTNGTLPLASLPVVVVTNNESGLTLGGTFNGNGSNLTGVALLQGSNSFNGTQRFAGGNVGIGYGASPNPVYSQEALYINSSNPIGAIIGMNGTTTGGHHFEIVSAGTGAAQPAGAFGIFDYNAGAYRLSINSNGNTGIGTTTPVAKLEVNGNAQIDGTLSGNGAGLTNIPASAVVTAPPGMALIPAGPFTMGDTLDSENDAIPSNITVSAFYMGVNLVSLSQWQSVYFWATNNGYSFDNGGTNKAANNPVEPLNWYDCVKWCNARSQQAGLTPVYYTDTNLTHLYTNGDIDLTATNVNWAANGYRLPTEAEWEKAARGGLSGQRFPWGNVINENLADYLGATNSYSYDLGPNGTNAAFTNGVAPFTSPVGYFAANGYGLYDMAGNVFEWCWDWYGTPYGQPTATNPTGPATSTGSRVQRGGNWSIDASYAHCATREPSPPGLASNNYFGFRCVRGH